jgi:molecular chaperone GrpE
VKLIKSPGKKTETRLITSLVPGRTNTSVGIVPIPLIVYVRKSDINSAKKNSITSVMMLWKRFGYPLRFTQIRSCGSRTEKTLEQLSQDVKSSEENLLALKNKLQMAEEDALQASKRHSQQLENSTKYAIVPLAKDLLNIHDNLKRAIGCLTEEDKTHSKDIREILKILSHTENLLTETFEEYGIEETDPLGHAFDPNFHEAMFEFPDPERKTGEIGHVITSGFTIHDRVLRAAKVGVARN